MRKPNDETIATPEFDILIGNQPPCLLDGFRIVGAREPLKAHEMSVVPNKIYPILVHPEPPLAILGIHQTLFGNKWQWLTRGMPCRFYCCWPSLPAECPGRKRHTDHDIRLLSLPTAAKFGRVANRVMRQRLPHLIRQLLALGRRFPPSGFSDSLRSLGW